jgi:hypothetical protein
MIVQPSRDNSCAHCGGPLIDQHTGDIVIPGSARPVGGAIRKSRLRLLRIFSALALILAAIALAYTIYREDIPALIQKIPGINIIQTSTVTQSPTSTLPATKVPTSTNRLVPSETPEPTFTFAPLIVDFSSILQQSVGSIVILTGRLSMPQQTECTTTTCWIYLRDPVKSSNKIVVFLRIPPLMATAAPGQMERLPDNYSFMHLKVRTDDGEWIQVNTILTITGSICKTDMGEMCIDQVSHIIKSE